MLVTRNSLTGQVEDILGVLGGVVVAVLRSPAVLVGEREARTTTRRQPQAATSSDERQGRANPYETDATGRTAHSG